VVKSLDHQLLFIVFQVVEGCGLKVSFQVRVFGSYGNEWGTCGNESSWGNL